MLRVLACLILLVGVAAAPAKRSASRPSASQVWVQVPGAGKLPICVDLQSIKQVTYGKDTYTDYSWEACEFTGKPGDLPGRGVVECSDPDSANANAPDRYVCGLGLSAAQGQEAGWPRKLKCTYSADPRPYSGDTTYYRIGPREFSQWDKRAGSWGEFCYSPADTCRIDGNLFVFRSADGILSFQFDLANGAYFSHMLWENGTEKFHSVGMCSPLIGDPPANG